jgi:hypothetical protein
MKNTPSTINRIVTIAGLALGAFAISAFAQTGTWTGPPAGTPPDCPTTTPGCNAPINSGDTLQSKIGSLKVGLSASNAVTGALSVGGLNVLSSTFLFKPSAAAVTPGYVLTASNSGGTVAWAPIPPEPGQCRFLISTFQANYNDAYKYQIIDVPNECINNSCTLFMPIYDGATIDTMKTTILTQFIAFFGNPGTDFWAKPGSTNDGTSCLRGQNGTTYGCDSILNMDSSTDRLVLYDDLSGTENNSTQWTLKDTADRWAELYVCS